MSCSTTTRAWRAVELADQARPVRSSLLVGHAGGRLVEQDELGLGRDHHGELDQLALAVRRAGRPCAPAMSAMPSAVQRPRRRAGRRCAPGATLRRRRARRSRATLRPSNTLGTWVLMPMPRRAMACGASAGDRLAAEQRRRRAVGLSWPVRHLKKVLLPAPFGPIRQRSSPSREREADAGRRATTPPKRMVKSPGLEQRRCSRSARCAARPRPSHGQPSARAASAQRRQALRQRPARRRPGCTPSTQVGDRPSRSLAGSGAEVAGQELHQDAADDRPDQRAERRRRSPR